MLSSSLHKEALSDKGREQAICTPGAYVKCPKPTVPYPTYSETAMSPHVPEQHPGVHDCGRSEVAHQHCREEPRPLPTHPHPSSSSPSSLPHPAYSETAMSPMCLSKTLVSIAAAVK